MVSDGLRSTLFQIFLGEHAPDAPTMLHAMRATPTPHSMYALWIRPCSVIKMIIQASYFRLLWQTICAVFILHVCTKSNYSNQNPNPNFWNSISSLYISLQACNDQIPPQSTAVCSNFAREGMITLPRRQCYVVKIWMLCVWYVCTKLMFATFMFRY